MSEAKPIPNEILFQISQLLKGNPDKPEGKLLNMVPFLSSLQPVLEKMGTGGRSSYMENVGVGMDAADMVPGGAVVGALSSKARNALIKMFEKKGGSGYASWKTGRDNAKKDTDAFLMKNPSRLTNDQVENIPPYAALDMLARPVPPSMRGVSDTTGDSLMVGVTNKKDFFDATHYDAFTEIQKAVNDLEGKYGKSGFEFGSNDQLLGNDYSKRIDGYAVRDNRGGTHFADRNTTAKLVEKATGINMFPDDNEAESIALNTVREFINKAKLDTEDFVDIKDYVYGKQDIGSLEHIIDRMDWNTAEEFRTFFGDLKRKYNK